MEAVEPDFSLNLLVRAMLAPGATAAKLIARWRWPPAVLMIVRPGRVLAISALCLTHGLAGFCLLPCPWWGPA